LVVYSIYQRLTWFSRKTKKKNNKKNKKEITQIRMNFKIQMKFKNIKNP